MTQDDALNVVGVDDWAFRRNHRYGTVVCDLEKRRIVKLLPDREIATVFTFLAQHPENCDCFPRPRRWLSGSCRQGFTPCHAGRRSLAFDGERQRGVPRRRAQIHASDPYRNWCYDDQSCATHLR